MQVEALWTFPLKSAAGIALNEMVIEPRGPRYDRRWMLIDNDNGFITARKYPRLVLVQTRLVNGKLHLSAPGQSDLVVPAASGRARVPVTIWKDRVDAALVSEEVDAWLSAFLGVPCRLVAMDNAARRTMVHDAGFENDEVSFADGMPVLLCNAASLAQVNTWAGEDFPMLRFRPNVVFSGAPAFAEDDWRELQIGELVFRAVKVCRRCVLTTIDPENGEKHPRKQPLATLAIHRKVEGGVAFGLNLSPVGSGTLRVGDAVTVLR